MFAILVLEREPMKLEDLPAALQTWIMAAGGIASIAVAVWLIANLIQPPREGSILNPRTLLPQLLTILIGGLAVALLPLGMRWLWNVQGWTSIAAAPETEAPSPFWVQYGVSCALVAALLPVFRNLPSLRGRRIWAISKLSFKEAIRGRILWSFSAFLLVILFATWFLPYKPEDQVRNYVRVVYWAMSPLLLMTAGLVASFSIPADLRRQTMHTIVTKPVERFEIVLGRCLGYILLLSLVLGVMTLISLIYVARGIDPEASEESFKARVPLFGEMEIWEGNQKSPGKFVGREWDYRHYITGGVSEERAIWSFVNLPTNLGDRDTLRCEFAFDIFRTTKGIENKGVYCTFIFETWQWDAKKLNEYVRERDQLLASPDAKVMQQSREENWPLDKTRAVLLSSVAEKYGYYELTSKEVVDYHTLSVAVPGSLFKNLKDWNQLKPPKPTELNVVVRCESRTQYLGLAKHDLYLLADEKPFAINFFKGAIGLWDRLVLVIVMAVTLSTYLSGIISFLSTFFFYFFGLLVDFVKQLAEGKVDGGGPAEALIRLSTGTNLIVPLDQTATVRVALGSDQVFRFLLRRFLNLIPDVDRFDLTNYVAQGFDIPMGVMVIDNFVYLVGYLVPWIVLGFFLIRSREIAS